MKWFGILLLLALQVSIVTAEEQLIVCGTHPGEIYFDGIHPQLAWLLTGFYFSADGGGAYRNQGSGGLVRWPGGGRPG